MADDVLNANQLVARWHASAQRPGFKFLVVQIVCSLTGGPQQCKLYGDLNSCLP